MTENASVHKRGRKLEEAVYIEIARTADFLTRRVAQLLKTEDLSLAQYNILRILRGSPQGLSCGDIGARMVTRDPDITRLLDRLAKRGLISRRRETKDRRMVLTRITPEGSDVLSRLDEPVASLHKGQLGHLGRERLEALCELLAACREDR